MASSSATGRRARTASLGSVRARTTLAATSVVAIGLVAAVAALTFAVEQTLVSRVHARGDAEVDAVVERLVGGATPEEALAPTTAPDTVGGEVPTYVAILDREGHPVVGSGFFGMPGIEEGEGVSVETSDGDWRRVVRVGSSDLAIAQRSVEVDGRLLLVVAASPLAEVVRSVEVIVQLSSFGVPLLALLVGVVTWLATGRTLRPIEVIRAEVEALSSLTLERRLLVPPSGDEVARLAETMNRMLARLEAAAVRQREFVSDASHELRSPVASIRAGLEVALIHPAASSWQEVAGGVLSETGRLERIIDDLLLLARLDEGARPPATVVDVGCLTRELVTRVAGVAVEVDIADGLLVRGRDDVLASVIRNLLDNAARHATSAVAVTAAARGTTVVVTVDDDGPGIPPADRQRVFQRFTRLDQPRSRADGGVGLGLAVVERVVSHHHGSVTIGDSPTGGARFEVVLPAAP
jgi:signal transduction histidine kinase